MKLISEQQLLQMEETWKMLNEIPVSGQKSVFLMGSAMSNLQEIAKAVMESPDVDDPRDEEKKDEEKETKDGG